MTTSRIVTRSRRSRFEGAYGEHFDLCTAGLRFRGFSFAITVKRVSTGSPPQWNYTGYEPDATSAITLSANNAHGW
jgi:hypothetical protein